MTKDLQNLLKTLPPEQRQQWHNAIVEATGERSAGDYDWVDPDDHLKGIKLSHGRKMLPRKANGAIMGKFKVGEKTCTILPVDQVSLLRWHMFQKIGISGGTGKSFQAIIEGFMQSSRIAVKRGVSHEDSMIAVVTHNQHQIKEVLKFSKERWEAIYYTCSVFMVWDDEDLTKWDGEEQAMKIKEINDYGYINGDFFLLLSQSLAGLQSIFKDMGGVEVMNQDPSFMEVTPIIPIKKQEK